VELKFDVPEEATVKCNIKLNLFDTSGDPRHRAITLAHFRNAMGALICFDLSSS
jgi:GTPase SAR1 family protein